VVFEVVRRRNSKQPSIVPVDAENESGILTTKTGKRATASHACPSEQAKLTVASASTAAMSEKGFEMVALWAADAALSMT
jgi:hypothetical protein